MRNTKKKGFWKPVALGFGMVYVLTMGLATWLVKEKFTEDYDRRFQEAAIYVMGRISDKEFAMEEEGWSSEDSRRYFYQTEANDCLWRIGSDELQISVGFYDREGHLLARTRNEVGGGHVVYEGSKIRELVSYRLEDYLSAGEVEELAGYLWEEACLRSPEFPGKYRFSIRTSPDEKGELWEIYVQEITWTEEKDMGEERYEDPLRGGYHSIETNVMVDYETGEETGEPKEFYETDSRIVWQWTNPSVDARTVKNGIVSNTYAGLPYLNAYTGSLNSWKRWNSSPYLQDFPEYEEFSWEGVVEEPPLVIDSDGLWYRGNYKLQVGMIGDPFCYMVIRMESLPWLEAVKYMKYVYLAGLVMTAACMVKIVWAFKKTYEKQAALEETRRDFTNAMAHELKTPLAVIRNFAENLMEHTMEEKREYYLTQIIGQTEEMDRLVEKMIEVSKLDSQELVLGEEPVALGEVFREQAARFEPMIQAKGLSVEMETEEDFLVKGDREYLEKAVWNLLCNAVDYNVAGGRIKVRIEKDRCVVENTGNAMTGEDMEHAFDLFYSGDKSRNRKDRHMGMGLFLTRKILGLHNLELTLENLEDGVRVVIRRQ